MAIGFSGDTNEGCSGGDTGVAKADVFVDDAGDADTGVLLLLSASISLARLVFFNFDRAPDKNGDSLTSTSWGEDAPGDRLLGLLSVLRII